MGGVTVSAKANGSLATTSVFTGADGNFYFPRLPEGQYEVRAQAVGFEAGRSNIDLRGSVQHQDFTLKTATTLPISSRATSGSRRCRKTRKKTAR